jgi:glucose dehydrogenase
MNTVVPRFSLITAFASCLLVAATSRVAGQSGSNIGEWRSYGANIANTHYSPLDQIKGDNFNKLEVAWEFKAGEMGPQPENNMEGTPLMVNGVFF